MYNDQLPLAVGEKQDPQLVGIPAESIPFLWEMIEPDLRQAWEAVDHGEVPVEHMYAELLDRKLQGWFIIQDGEILGVGTTRIDHYGEDQVCWVYSLRCKHFLQNREAIENQLFAWAKAYRCNKFWLTGRHGWSKAMPDWKPISINGLDILEKRL